MLWQLSIFIILGHNISSISIFTGYLRRFLFPDTPYIYKCWIAAILQRPRPCIWVLVYKGMTVDDKSWGAIPALNRPIFNKRLLNGRIQESFNCCDWLIYCFNGQ